MSAIFWRIHDHGISCCTFSPTSQRPHGQSFIKAEVRAFVWGMVHGWIQNLKIPLARLYMIHLHMYKTPIITLGPCLFDLNQIHEVRCWEWSSDFILFNRLITVSILDQGTQLGLLDFCLVERKVPDRSCGFAKKMVQKWVSHRSLIQRPLNLLWCNHELNPTVDEFLRQV